MDATSNRKKLLAAWLAGALAATFPALAVSNAPEAGASGCTKWVFGSEFTLVNDIRPPGIPETITVPVNPPETTLFATGGNDGVISNSSIGRYAHIVVRVDAGLVGQFQYDGEVDSSGSATGDYKLDGKPRGSWHSAGNLICLDNSGTSSDDRTKTKDCPDGSSVPADQRCPAPKDAVHVTITPGSPKWTVSAVNTVDIPGKCVYTATNTNGAWPTFTNPFDIQAIGRARPFPVDPPPPFSTWHVETVCTGPLEGETVEIGRDIQDCTPDGCTPVVKP